MPRWYALMFQMPTSSVMMAKMFGFFVAMFSCLLGGSWY
jgi:hypothetical protein